MLENLDNQIENLEKEIKEAKEQLKQRKLAVKILKTQSKQKKNSEYFKKSNFFSRFVVSLTNGPARLNRSFQFRVKNPERFYYNKLSGQVEKLLSFCRNLHKEDKRNKYANKMAVSFIEKLENFVANTEIEDIKLDADEKIKELKYFLQSQPKSAKTIEDIEKLKNMLNTLENIIQE